MKRSFYSALLVMAICSTSFIACNGDYTASPGSSNDGIVNPLNPLSISEFTWTGSGALSATVDGASFVADSTHTTWVLDTTGGNIIYGINGTKGIILYLNGVYSGGLYQMNYHMYNTSGTYIDTIGSPNAYYYSYNGNSGEVTITENDSAYIKGEFYFEGVSPTGAIKAINKGYFSVHKL